ncbi:MAG: BlaI/MecI/CopY family transcriptional regulator [Myxococcales bacterium]|nr:BlaI/MecI/CopY family transcriptional regulator [Myxococcales bacterium]
MKCLVAMNKPTDAELTILQVLWDHGPGTVRAIHESLGQPGAYTTTLKQLQIMFEKGLVLRDDSARSHIYRAAIKRDQVQRTLLKDLLGKAFGGSTSGMVMRALSMKQTSAEEIAEIRELLDRIEEQGE